MMIFLRLLAAIIGILVVYGTLRSAIRTLLTPRSIRDPITSAVFIFVRRLFNIRLRWLRSYASRDHWMAYYAPVSLLVLLLTYLALVQLGFMFLLWASGVSSWGDAFTVSGSSLLTLGFAKGDTFLQTVLDFLAAAIGLILVALVIAYLPTMYNAYSEREKAVTLLEVMAGKPPSAVTMLLRYYRNNGLEELHQSWATWEEWFAYLEESHTALAALVFFRSSRPEHSWVTAAGTILDAAALSLSTIEMPFDAQAALCIRSGYLALRRIADIFLVPYKEYPHFPTDPISISRAEFDAAYDELREAGMPLKDDRDQAWVDFAGWRVNYDRPLLALSQLTMAPETPWTADREPASAG
ncbi:MAG: hypothetical protein JSW55_03825 [Chloroflexota bacterium]|nr:MAG: hypothetical protein JSW55_03825 [Chloroflexota bacterium]